MKQGSHGSHDESTMKLVYNADCLQKIQNETATKRWVEHLVQPGRLYIYR